MSFRTDPCSFKYRQASRGDVNREQWARDFVPVVDSRQPEKIAAYMTSNVRLQMASM